jgi:hypothetical protein
MSWLGDFGDEALGLLATFAPSVATALGGPLAGMAVQALASALLPDVPEPTAKQLSAAVRGLPPEQAVRLREIETSFALAMKNADVELDRIAAGDTANARDREKSVRDGMNATLALTVTVGFFGALIFISLYELPAGSRDILNGIILSLNNGWMLILGYYFGSSAGSRQKNNMLEDALRK